MREFVLPPPESRWARMEDRILRRARKAGLPQPWIEMLSHAHRRAMALRSMGAHALSSEEHPAWLHPGRVALILMDDFEELDPGVLMAGTLAESRDLELRLEEKAAGEVLGHVAGSFDLWKALPAIPWRVSGQLDADADASLLEALVLAPPGVQRVAMAEALDHIRHAHLWESREERRRAADLAREVIAPLAPRVHPTLERRIEWWVRRVSPGL